MRDFSHIYQNFIFCYDDTLFDRSGNASLSRGNELICRTVGEIMQENSVLIRNALYAVDDTSIDALTPAEFRTIRKLREFLLDIRMQRYEAQKCFSYVNMNTGKSACFLNGHFFDVHQSQD